MWPAVTYETRPWKYEPHDLVGVSKSRRRRILPTYEAALPATIADRAVHLPAALLRRIEEVEHVVIRFDQKQASHPYNLPALILRSESSSSSQIEGTPACAM